MISQAESFLHLVTAAGISTAMIGFGLRGRRSTEPLTFGGKRRSPRWLWILAGIVGTGMTISAALVDDLRLVRDGSAVAAAVAGVFIAFVLGGVLVRKGLRGRRIGDHPYCRRCGFDLFGMPATSTVCTECGLPLDGPGGWAAATAVGYHERRRVPLLIGAFLIILGLGVTAPMARDAYRWSQTVNWNRHKPEAWVLANARSSDPMVSAAAMTELDRRAPRLALSPSGIAAYVDILLAAPAPLGAASWFTHASTAQSLAEESWALGTLDEAVVRRVMRANANLSLTVAPQASRGVMLRYYVRAPDYLLALRHTGRKATIAVTDVHIRLNDLDVPPDARMQAVLPGTDEFFTLPSPGKALKLDGLGDRLRLGPATLELRCHATVMLDVPNRPVLTESLDLVLKGNTTVVKPQAMYCPLVPVPSVVKDANDKTPLSIGNEPPYYVYVQGEFLVLRSTLQRSFVGDCVMNTPTGEQSLGTLYIPSGYETRLPLLKPLARDATFTFRPRPELGAELFSVVPIHAEPYTVKPD